MESWVFFLKKCFSLFSLPSIKKYIFHKDPVCGLAHTQRKKNGNKIFMKLYFLSFHAVHSAIFYFILLYFIFEMLVLTHKIYFITH